jgi:hypothetical protein
MSAKEVAMLPLLTLQAGVGSIFEEAFDWGGRAAARIVARRPRFS